MGWPKLLLFLGDTSDGRPTNIDYYYTGL